MTVKEFAEFIVGGNMGNIVIYGFAASIDIILHIRRDFLLLWERQVTIYLQFLIIHGERKPLQMLLVKEFAGVT